MPKQTKQSKSSDDFVSDEVLGSGSASFLKFKERTTQFRVLSKPVIGWVSWEDKEPTRSHIDDEPESTDAENKPKKFMMLAVLDREDDGVKILEITQQSVIKSIKALAANKDWGNPFTYDIAVSKSGEGMKTKYTVQPSPKKPLEKELQKAALSRRCNLDSCFEGKDVWNTEDGETEYFFK